jgi:putative ABC transport system permease protein
MTSLITSMLRVRGFQAIVLTLLAALGFAGAVAIPAFLTAANESVISTEIDHATTNEQVIEAARRFTATAPWARPDSTFAGFVPQSMTEPDLSVVYADETDVMLLGPVQVAPRLVFRQDVCDHVVLTAGRCPVGTNEVMISAEQASKESLTAGDVVPLVYANVIYSGKNGPGISAATGYTPVTYDIVGVYRPRVAGEAYWGDEPLFQSDQIRGTDTPVFGTAGSIGAINHGVETERVDAILDPAALRAGRIAAIRAQVQHAAAAAAVASSGTSSEIPRLLDDIDRDLAATHQTVLLVGLPLIGLCWLVVFLAAAYAVSGRREEIGVVKMRGVGYTRRFWLGSGEAILSILVAVPIGYLIAALAIRPVVRHLLPGDPAYPAIGPGALPYVVVTLAGCLVATAAAGYRVLRSPAPDLLRGVPPRPSRWRTAAVEVLVVVFAAASVEQLLTERSTLSGIDLVAPWFAIAAIGVLSARLLVPLVGWIGRIGLRRGRRSLGLGIGALQIARRPGATRVFVLTVIAFGLVTYAAASTGVAGTVRTDRARVGLGAATVVSVAPVSRLTLLAAVRAADPDGRYAMAVAAIPPRTAGSPSILAVDSTRLAAVSAWPDGGLSAAAAQRLLAPPANAPIVMRGGIMAVDLLVAKASPDPFTPYLELYVQPLDGGAAGSVTFYRPDPMKPEYDADAGQCRAAGCRIAGLRLHDDSFYGGQITVTLSAPRIVDPGPAAFDAFATSGAWRSIPGAGNAPPVAVSAAATGLTISGTSDSAGFSAQIEPTDSAFPAPALATGALGVTTEGAVGHDRVGIPMQQVARVPMLPGVPGDAVLLDLQDADRIAMVTDDNATDPQVWLAASAPADMADRLAKAGLQVTGVISLGPLVTYLDNQGPAVGSLFYVLSTVGAILLSIGAMILSASVDRRRRGRELQALRVQGLPARSVAYAALFAQIGLTVMAVIGGLVAGLAGWRLTGAKIPIFADGRTVAGVSIWPDWTGLLVPLAVAAALLLIVSSVAAWDLRRYVRRGDLESLTGR